MSLLRHLSPCLLALTFAIPAISACGDSSDDDGSSVGDGGAGNSGGTGNHAGDGNSAGTAGTAGTGNNVEDGCDGITPKVIEIGASDLNDMLESEEFKLLNVHIPRAGEISGTDAHVAYNDTAALEAELGGDLGAKAVLYCLTGPMSSIATKALVALGYCRIYDLPGGMIGWETEGYPVDE